MLSVNDKVELIRACEDAYHYLQLLSNNRQSFVSIDSMPHNKTLWFDTLDCLAATIEDLDWLAVISGSPTMPPKVSNDIYEAAEAAEDAFIDLKYYSNGVDKSRKGIAYSGMGKEVNESLNNHIEAVKEPFEKLESKYIPNELGAK